MKSSFTAPAALQTAVLFLVFNRPDTTAQVFEAIRQAKPPRLYVACDGPREGRDGEAERVAKVHEISTQVDWPCEVKTLFRKTNLGCKYAVSGAITWFFEQEEQGIILEDDCLPSQSFFWFCEQLLNQYATDERISIISGYNKQQSWWPDKYDYFFSNFGGIWGWASWRRAWNHMDLEMTCLEKLAQQGYFENLLGRKLGSLRKKQLLNAKISNLNGEMSSWAYPWAYSRHKQAGMACVPTVSLIMNIGFGVDATHTINDSSQVVIAQELSFPILINSECKPDEAYDLLFIEHPNLLARMLGRLKRWTKC
jgi:hypothetical protein